MRSKIANTESHQKSKGVFTDRNDKVVSDELTSSSTLPTFDRMGLTCSTLAAPMKANSDRGDYHALRLTPYNRETKEDLQNKNGHDPVSTTNMAQGVSITSILQVPAYTKNLALFYFPTYQKNHNHANLRACESYLNSLGLYIGSRPK
jgi:hypothetical protein